MARAETTFKIKGVCADKEVKLPKFPFLLSPSGPVGTNDSSETSFLKDHNSSYWILPIQQKWFTHSRRRMRVKYTFNFKYINTYM